MNNTTWHLFQLFSFLLLRCLSLLFFFFFNDTATTEIYTLSLHDALPILFRNRNKPCASGRNRLAPVYCTTAGLRSEEHTSELQSHSDLVCRLLLEKKKKKNNKEHIRKRDASIKWSKTNQSVDHIVMNIIG